MTWKVEKGYVPVYLPDGKTLAGQARFSEDGESIEINVPSDSPIPGIMGDNLLGVQLIYMTNEARDRVREKLDNDGA